MGICPDPRIWPLVLILMPFDDVRLLRNIFIGSLHLEITRVAEEYAIPRRQCRAAPTVLSIRLRWLVSLAGVVALIVLLIAHNGSR